MDDTSKNCGTECNSSAVKLLKEDQASLCKMFSNYEKTTDFKEKEDLVSAISIALNAYSTLENEVVYPALKEKESCSDEPCSGAESHHQMRLIVDQLQRLTADGDQQEYEKGVSELKLAVQKHFDSEEKLLFPAIEKCSTTAEKVGAKVQEFRAERSTPQLAEK
ncbi:hypothetical protein BH11CYA1_BH11CYA1_49200 [soil metagenome]